MKTRKELAEELIRPLPSESRWKQIILRLTVERPALHPSPPPGPVAHRLALALMESGALLD